MNENIVDWFTRSETLYLIGAGCSKCCDKPLIGELTKIVISEQNADVQSLFDDLSSENQTPLNIEDFLNFLLGMLSLSKKTTRQLVTNFSNDAIDDAIMSICRSIVQAIADDWQSSDYHARFLRRVAQDGKARDIFTLNYDTLIESTLEDLMFPYVDGFHGANRAFFDHTLFEQTRTPNPKFNLFKLHGSINWVRDANEVPRRIPLNSLDDSLDRLLIYPSEQKYIETRYGIYENLMKIFRHKLRSSKSNTLLVTLGYSFNDLHINEAIIDAISTDNNNLTLIGFVGADTDLAGQQARLEKIALRRPSQINFYVGNKFFIGDALDRGESEDLLSRDLWRFECAVDFIAGK